MNYNKFRQMQKDLIIRYKFWEALGNLGLFDYKDFSLKFQEGATITESGILFQNNQNSSLLFVKMDNVPKNGQIQSFTPLFSIQSNGKQYKITDIKNEKEPLSEICSKHFEYKKQGIELIEGSILKIGKVQAKILAIQLNQQKKQFGQMSFKEPAIKKISQNHYIEENQSIIQEIKLSQSANTNTTQKVIQSTKYSLVEENPCCRICYGKTITTDNNFTMLCKCEGFTKYIHQKCLAEWLFMKGKFFTEKFGKNSQTLIYTAEKTAFQCEICKTSYPLPQLLQLMTRDFEDPGKFKPLKKFKKFFSFQVTASESTKIFIVDLQQLHQIKIGRLNQCDIYIPDLSISRQHCTIHLTKKEDGKETLIVKDNQSKFGTIIKKSSIVIKQSDVLFLQKGKNVFEIKQKQRKVKFWKKMLGMCAPDFDLAQ